MEEEWTRLNEELDVKIEELEEKDFEMQQEHSRKMVELADAMADKTPLNVANRISAKSVEEAASTAKKTVKEALSTPGEEQIKNAFLQDAGIMSLFAEKKVSDDQATAIAQFFEQMMVSQNVQVVEVVEGALAAKKEDEEEVELVEDKGKGGKGFTLSAAEQKKRRQLQRKGAANLMLDDTAARGSASKRDGDEVDPEAQEPPIRRCMPGKGDE